VGDDLIGRLAQDTGARDREFPHHRVEFPLVADRAAEPAILLEIAWRVRHHPENIGVAVLAQNFARPLIRFRSIAIVDTGHVSPWDFEALFEFFCLRSNSSPDTIRPTTSDQQLGPPHKIRNAADVSPDFTASRVRQSRHLRVKMPPQYYSTLIASMFAEWGLKSKRILVVGCSRVKDRSSHAAFAGNDDSRPSLGRNA
jgi:hypothetical protein